MLASINPLGERARGTRFARTFAWYLAGSVAGGAIAGGVLGLVGAGLAAIVDPDSTAVAVAVLVVALVGLAFDLRLAALRLPTVRRQVNEDWLARYRGWVYGLGFGFELGLGVVTIVTTAAVYVMLALALLTASPLLGVAIGAVFGATRAMPLLAVRHVDEAGQLRAAMRHAERLAPTFDRANRLAIATLAVAALALAMTGAA